MSGFTERMIDDGFTEPQAYMDYLENEADNQMNNQIDEWDYFDNDEVDEW